MNGLYSVSDNLFEMVFRVFPWMFGGLMLLGLLTHVVAPIVGAMISEWHEGRQAARNKAAEAERYRGAAASEVALRAEFDDWLEAEILRLLIEHAAHPDDQGIASQLAKVETAKAENAARIVALHQRDPAQPVKTGGAEAVNREWDSLRAKGAATQAVPA